MSCGGAVPCPRACCLCPPPVAPPTWCWRSVGGDLPDFPTESCASPTPLPCHRLPLTAYLASLTPCFLSSVLCEEEDTVRVARPPSAHPAAVTLLQGAARHAPVGWPAGSEGQLAPQQRRLSRAGRLVFSVGFLQGSKPHDSRLPEPGAVDLQTWRAPQVTCHFLTAWRASAPPVL